MEVHYTEFSVGSLAKIGYKAESIYRRSQGQDVEDFGALPIEEAKKRIFMARFFADDLMLPSMQDYLDANKIEFAKLSEVSKIALTLFIETIREVLKHRSG